VTESYRHGTISEIEASCLKGCFLCGHIYQQFNLHVGAPGGKDLLDAAKESTDRFRIDIIAREYTQECRIEFRGLVYGHVRVYVDGGRCDLSSL
jgi:hypothetical protein